MLKVLGYLFLHLSLIFEMAHAQSAQGQPSDSDKRIELLCKLDTGVDVRYTVDLARQLLYVTVMLERGEDGAPITVSAREIRREVRFKGELLHLITIDRYTLEFQSYVSILQQSTKRGDGWVRGQCELLKQRVF